MARGLSTLRANQAAARVPGWLPRECCTGHGDGSRALLDVFSEAGYSSVYARFPGYSGQRLLDVVPGWSNELAAAWSVCAGVQRAEAREQWCCS